MSNSTQGQSITLNHIALYVTDLAVSVTFYRDVIGLQTIEEPFKDGLHAWFEIGGGLTLHLIQGAKEIIKQYRSTHTCYSVGDLKQFILHLGNAGITYEDARGNKNAITVRADGIEQIYITDPDGYWVEINNDK